MHAYLVSDLNLPNSPDTLNIYPDPSIGIEQIRIVQNFLSRKPSQSAANTVIVHEAEKLTLSAQQAFLKTLEEPPGNSQIYLITSQPNILLPTILSRVQIIDSPTITSYPDPPDWVNKFLTVEAGERLKILDLQALNRDSALEFINQLEFLIHKNISSGKYLSPQVYNLVSDTRMYLKANCNVKITLDFLGLNF